MVFELKEPSEERPCAQARRLAAQIRGGKKVDPKELGQTFLTLHDHRNYPTSSLRKKKLRDGTWDWVQGRGLLHAYGPIESFKDTGDAIDDLSSALRGPKEGKPTDLEGHFTNQIVEGGLRICRDAALELLDARNSTNDKTNSGVLAVLERRALDRRAKAGGASAAAAQREVEARPDLRASLSSEAQEIYENGSIVLGLLKAKKMSWTKTNVNRFLGLTYSTGTKTIRLNALAEVSGALKARAGKRGPKPAP